MRRHKMQLNRRTFSSYSLWALAGAGASAFAQAEGKIVLGQSAPFTGPSAELGLRFSEGAQLYFDAINAKGGVHGRQIELRKADDGYEPERTVANTRKFIADGVLALFGYIGTPTTLAALPLATTAKVPLIAPFTGAGGLREPLSRYVFHVRASYDDETQAIVRHCASIGQNTLAVFYQNDAYGKAGLNGVTKALHQLGKAPVAVGTVERNSVDVAQAVSAIVATNPSAVVQISSYAASAAFIRAARAAGFTGKFYNVSFVGTQALSKTLGAEARGVVVSQVMPFPFSHKTPIGSEYLTAIKAANLPGLVPNYSGMEGFVAAKVLVEALQRAGRAPTPETLVNAFDSLQKFNLGGFAVDFSAQKHTGSQFVEMTILTDNGGVIH
jgi:ABC-type branched-subunit amino acid transport system substrate-binding protein